MVNEHSHVSLLQSHLLGSRMLLTGYITLSGQNPLSRGGRREVFAVPDCPGLIVKVETQEHIDRPVKLLRRIVRKNFPDTLHNAKMAEAKCEMVVALRLGPDALNSPLPKFFGMTLTDLGSGSVVEKITDQDGNIAPTLGLLRDQGALDDRLIGLLNEFVRKIYELHVTCTDIHEDNIVLGCRSDVEAFFLIDGYGDRNIVPLRSWFRSVNDNRLDKQFQEMAGNSNLIWNSSQRAFRPSSTQ